MKRTLLSFLTIIAFVVLGTARTRADSASDRSAISDSLSKLAGVAQTLSRTSKLSEDRGVRKKFAPLAAEIADDLNNLARRSLRMDVAISSIVQTLGPIDRDAVRLIDLSDEAEDKGERRSLRKQAQELQQTISMARKIIEAIGAKPVGPTAMSDGAFQQLANSVKRASFDKDRANVIADAARYNWFTSNQLAYLIGLMSFDSDRVNAAASAWNKLVDPQNSSVIYDRLSFSSSRDQLRRRVSR